MQDGAFVDLGQVGAASVGTRPIAVAGKPASHSRVWATAPVGPAPVR